MAGLWGGAWLVGLPARAQSTAAASLRVEEASAARSGWDAEAAPVAGWEPVRLPDEWSQRWPGFDGVVWYRLQWTEPEDRPVAARALLIEYVTMAGAVYVNGSLIGRDRRLTEPLSRSWNMPRQWVLDAPLLRPGRNEVIVRVSGFAAFQPGVGPVMLGTPTQIAREFDSTLFERRSLQWLGIGLTLAMGVIFGMLWLLRRAETAYGWFAAFSLAWMPYSYNFIATESWPLSSTHAFQRMVTLALLLSIAMFVQFTWSVCQLSMPGLRRVVLGLAALAGIAVLVEPLGLPVVSVRTMGIQTALGMFILSSALIMWHAWRTREVEAIALAACTLLPIVAGVHDTLVFMQVVPGSRYYVTASSSAMLVGISFVLTWRFVQGMRLVENFNVELQTRVNDATGRLSDVLGRQHAAQMLQTRLSERLSLVRDLHDGLGMTLSSHIHRLRGDQGAGSTQTLHALEEVSADLRLIMESSALEPDDTLVDRLAPLRHRTTRVMEAAGIDCRWELHGLDDFAMESRRALDLLRLLQEALTNVLRHSGARHVRVFVDAREAEVTLTVSDDGRGLPAGPASKPASGGLGMASMHARAKRLEGHLHIDSDSTGTLLSLTFPRTSSRTTDATRPAALTD